MICKLLHSVFIYTLCIIAALWIMSFNMLGAGFSQKCTMLMTKKEK